MLLSPYNLQSSPLSLCPYVCSLCSLLKLIHNKIDFYACVLHVFNSSLNSCVCVPSCARLFVILGTVDHQTPLSMGFSRQEYWNGLPFPSPGDLPDPGIEPASPVSPELQVYSLPLIHQGRFWLRPSVVSLNLNIYSLCNCYHHQDT